MSSKRPKKPIGDPKAGSPRKNPRKTKRSTRAGLINPERSEPSAPKVVVPKNQIKLTEKELEAEHTRMLTATSPSAPSNLVRFSFKEQLFKLEGMVPQTEFHMVKDGNLVPAVTDDHGVGADYHHKPLRNQFNFSHRGTQSFSAPPKSRAVATEPPASETAKGSFSRGQIFDQYSKHRAAQTRREEAQRRRGPTGKRKEEGRGEQRLTFQAFDAPEDARESKREGIILDEDALSSALRLAERMIGENLYSDVIQDFAFWNDPSDQFKGAGSLLPLWRFSMDGSSSSSSSQQSHGPKSACCIEWHPSYTDLFAVGFGSFEFQRSSLSPPSSICIFSLKNPFHPELTIPTHADCLSVAWHPGQADILLAGFYDGTVAVYEVSLGSSPPYRQICCSSARDGKHLDPVWSVRWRPADAGSRQLSFYSVSSDGTVRCWAAAKRELRLTQTLELKEVADEGREGEVAEVALGGSSIAGGLSMSFNPSLDWMYAVSTDSGAIRLCSTAYSTHYLQSFLGHSLPVYGLSWNKYDTEVLASASEDWTIKIWKRERRLPITTLDLGVSVLDLQFSSVASCGLAAITADGKFHYYDFSQNQESPVCSQNVVSTGAKPTRLSLSPHYPVVAVGDSTGVIRLFKLSPNLRKRTKVEQPTARPRAGQPPPRKYTPEEIQTIAHDGEVKKLSDFIGWCVQSNKAAGLE